MRKSQPPWNTYHSYITLVFTSLLPFDGIMTAYYHSLKRFCFSMDSLVPTQWFVHMLGRFTHRVNSMSLNLSGSNVVLCRWPLTILGFFFANCNKKDSIMPVHEMAMYATFCTKVRYYSHYTDTEKHPWALDSIFKCTLGCSPRSSLEWGVGYHDHICSLCSASVAYWPPCYHSHLAFLLCTH